MSASIHPSPPKAATQPLPADTDPVTHFMLQQIERIRSLVGDSASSPEMQNALYSALVTDLTYLFAGALGMLICLQGDPEATLGPVIMAVMTGMQDQLAARRT